MAVIDTLKIPNKIISRMKRIIIPKPTITLSCIDLMDVYEVVSHSPDVSDNRLYRVCFANLPNDKLVSKFAVQMKSFDISTGVNTLSIQKVGRDQSHRWREFKSVQHHLKDFATHKEVTSIEIKKFVQFCVEQGIDERMLWQALLDDTYSKSEEITLTFYPTIIPLQHYATHLQKYNSHCLLFTQAKTGKSETCYRLYPNANFEDITIVTMLGTTDKDTKKVGLLEGPGIFFVDEINKMKGMYSGDTSGTKMLDFINTYLEKGIEKRGIWGEEIKVTGTKTVMFSGNIDIIKPGQRDFFHLMSKICTFSGDADKFGRRLGFFIYSPSLNIVQDTISEDPKFIELINTFRKEVLKDTSVQKRIMNILENNIDWVEEKDKEHSDKIKSYLGKAGHGNTAIKAFLHGMSLSSHRKLKFMALRISVIQHIFEIITAKKNLPNFFKEHKEEIERIYAGIKEVLCYKQIENLFLDLKATSNDKELVNKYLAENNINIHERFDGALKEKMCKDLNMQEGHLDKLLFSIKSNSEEKKAVG